MENMIMVPILRTNMIQVMEIVSNAIISDNYFPFKGEKEPYYNEYFAGARDSIIHDRRDPDFRTRRNVTLVSIDQELRSFVDAGVSKEEMEKILDYQILQKT